MRRISEQRGLSASGSILLVVSGVGALVESQCMADVVRYLWPCGWGNRFGQIMIVDSRTTAIGNTACRTAALAFIYRVPSEDHK